MKERPKFGVCCYCGRDFAFFGMSKKNFCCEYCRIHNLKGVKARIKEFVGDNKKKLQELNKIRRYAGLRELKKLPVAMDRSYLPGGANMIKDLNKNKKSLD